MLQLEDGILTGVTSQSEAGNEDRERRHFHALSPPGDRSSDAKGKAGVALGRRSVASVETWCQNFGSSSGPLSLRNCTSLFIAGSEPTTQGGPGTVFGGAST